MVPALMFRNGQIILFHNRDGCHYLSLLVLEWLHANKRGRERRYLVRQGYEFWNVQQEDTVRYLVKRSQCFPKYAQCIPHSSPGRYVVTVKCSKPDLCSYRISEGSVCWNREYKGTCEKIKHYFRRKRRQIKIRGIHRSKTMKNPICYVTLTDQLLLETRYPESRLTCNPPDGTCYV